MKKLKAEDARIIRISAKCSDLFTATVHDSEGKVIKDYSGYVPDFFPGEHYGDYVDLAIDLRTGLILNWKPTKKDLETFLNEKNT